MIRTVLIATGASVIWCAAVIASTFVPDGPFLTPIVVYVPGFLLLPVVVYLLWRTRKDALLCLALVPKPLLMLGFVVAVVGWLFSGGALKGDPSRDSLSGIAGLTMLLHVTFGLIAVGLLRFDRHLEEAG